MKVRPQTKKTRDGLHKPVTNKADLITRVFSARLPVYRNEPVIPFGHVFEHSLIAVGFHKFENSLARGSEIVLNANNPKIVALTIADESSLGALFDACRFSVRQSVSLVAKP